MERTKTMEDISVNFQKNFFLYCIKGGEAKRTLDDLTCSGQYYN